VPRGSTTAQCRAMRTPPLGPVPPGDTSAPIGVLPEPRLGPEWSGGRPPCLPSHADRPVRSRHVCASGALDTQTPCGTARACAQILPPVSDGYPRPSLRHRRLDDFSPHARRHTPAAPSTGPCPAPLLLTDRVRPPQKPLARSAMNDAPGCAGASRPAVPRSGRQRQPRPTPQTAPISSSFAPTEARSAPTPRPSAPCAAVPDGRGGTVRRQRARPPR
jgi:hypothetical protein